MRNLNREEFRRVSDAETLAAREQEPTEGVETVDPVSTVETVKTDDAVAKIEAQVAKLSEIVANLATASTIKEINKEAAEAVVEG